MSGRLGGWIVFVGGIAALNYAARFGAGGGSGQPAGQEVYSYSSFAQGLVVYVFFLVIVLLLALHRHELLALRRPASLARAAGIAVAAIVAVYAVEAIVSALPLPESPGKEQGLTPTHWEPAHAGAFAANVVLFVLVAPAVEELVFRGLGQSLLRPLGRWPSIVAIGIAFGLWHGLVEALLVLVPFGILLAYLRDRVDSVYPGMAVHGLFNAVALAAAVAVR